MKDCIAQAFWCFVDKIKSCLEQIRVLLILKQLKREQFAAVIKQTFTLPTKALVVWTPVFIPFLCFLWCSIAAFLSCVFALQLNRKVLNGTGFVWDHSFAFLKGFVSNLYEGCYIFRSPLTCLLNTGLNNSNYCTNTKVQKWYHSLQWRVAVKAHLKNNPWWQGLGKKREKVQFKGLFLTEHNSFMCVQDSFPCCLHFHYNKIGPWKCLVGRKRVL